MNHSLNCMDRETLERQVTLEEIKKRLGPLGSSKLRGPDGTLLRFVKKFGALFRRIYMILLTYSLLLVLCPMVLILRFSPLFQRNSLNLLLVVNSDGPVILSEIIECLMLIITTDWNAKTWDNIIRVLHVFYLARGLKINIHKVISLSITLVLPIGSI
ncbi:hypothetical protein Tco_0777483 [Tanacetum coccineum]